MENTAESQQRKQERNLDGRSRLCRVILHSDEITPMEFVVRVLQRFFQLTHPTATEVMYNAHFHGTAYVQTLPREAAQSRISLARFAAGIENYPLTFSTEAEESGS